MNAAVGGPRSPQEDARRLLQIYLHDHHSAAVGGVALARRCRASNAGSGSGAGLDEIVREIEEDFTVLERLLTRLQVKHNVVKDAAARVAVELGRLKLNGRVVAQITADRCGRARSVGVRGGGQEPVVGCTVDRPRRQQQLVGRVDLRSAARPGP